MKTATLLTIIIVAIIGGLLAQEKSGICLPEVHAKIPCHCLSMGGYQYCKDGHFDRGAWSDDGTPSPQCAMDCKEENCHCCEYMDKVRGKKQITIPYDRID